MIFVILILQRPQNRSRQEFEFIVQTIVHHSHNRSFPRRRGHSTRVFITNVEETLNPICAFILDRSQGGIGIIIGQQGDFALEQFMPNKFLKIKSVRAPLENSWITIQIRHYNRQPDCVFIGCKFLETICVADLSHYG